MTVLAWTEDTLINNSSHQTNSIMKIVFFGTTANVATRLLVVGREKGEELLKKACRFQ
jgi:hypothetical protein